MQVFDKTKLLAMMQELVHCGHIADEAKVLLSRAVQMAQASSKSR